MIISVDDSSPVPLFEQLRGQIAALIGSGALAPADPLPTVRQLAADLQIAPGTVQRAYQALRDQGLLESRGRGGTIVRAGPSSVTQPHTDPLAVAARAFVVRARQVADDPGRILAAVHEALNVTAGAEGEAAQDAARRVV